jgi:predicted hydrocarbon binding protein
LIEEYKMSEKVVGGGMLQVDDSGVITAFDRRWILFSVALLANMVDRLVGLLGPVAKRQIYEAGFSSGKIAGDRMRPHFGGGIEQVKKHLDLIYNMGWGKATTFEHDEATGKVTIGLSSSWEAAGFGEVHPNEKQKAVSCVLSSGLYAGAVSGAFDKLYEGNEVKCAAKGDEVCRFEFTPAGEHKKVMK